jgi:formylglycine-generating enzyme required for sulfatase activity
MPFQNPTTTAAPLTRTVTCEENADVFVQFDVALMRPAQQGFFDIAVNFNDIFCSAKFDCCTENAGGDACASDIDLLFEAGGSRGPTMVLGFACTAGANANADTELYLDALALDCTSPTAGSFAADITLNPSGAAGNQCTAGADGMSTCAAVTEANGVDADTYLYQLGVYRGLEQLTSGGVAAQKVYWNVALGVKRPAIASCWLKTQGTADDAAGSSVVDGGTIAAGAVYPFIQWEVDLNSCMAEPLSFGDANAMVRPEYTTTGGDAMAFGYGFGANLAAGAFDGGGASPCSPDPCLNGGTCTVAGAGYTCACVGGHTGTDCDVAPAPSAPSGFTCTGTVCDNPTTGEVWIGAGDFWMGCNSALDSACSALESPQHRVTFTSGYAIDTTPVTAGEYKACVVASQCTAPATTAGLFGTYDPVDKQDHPANYLTWSQASSYCGWAGKAAGVQRLCTEAEWERAARGGCETVTGDCSTGAQMRVYPWDAGDGSASVAPTCPGTANFYYTGGYCYPPVYTSAVDAHPAGASPYGALDMAGNLLEWTADWMPSSSANYPSGAVTDPTGAATGTERVYRGGRLNSAAAGLRTSARASAAPTAFYSTVGFRCCRTTP